MAPRWSSGGGDSNDSFPGITYPICDYNQAPFSWIKIALAINCVFFACTMILLAAAWRSRRFNGRCQSPTFYFLFSSLLFIGIATILSITSKSLFLADAHVGLSYQMFRGAYAFFYYPAKTALIGSIFAILHDRLRTLVSGEVSSRMRLVMYLNYFLVIAVFALSAILISFNFQFGADMMDIINGKATSFDSISRIKLHWNSVIIAYNSLILAIGLYFLGFSVYLLKHLNNQKAIKLDVRITLYMISPAVIAHGLYGAIVCGMLLHGDFSRSKLQYSTWSDLSGACVDTVTLTCAFAGIVWILFKQQKSVSTNADLSKNIRDSEEGSHH